MLTPRDLEVLDVIGEVMQQRLGEVRRDYEGKLDLLMAKVAALEARPEPNVEARMAELAHAYSVGLDQRFAALPPLPDLTPITEKLAALEARPVAPPVDVTPLAEKIAALEARPVPEVSSEMLLALGKEFREAIEQRVLDIEEKRMETLTATTNAVTRVEARTKEGFAEIVARVAALETAPKTDLTPIEIKLTALEARPLPPSTQPIYAMLDACRERLVALESAPKPDLTSIEAKLAELDVRPPDLKEVNENLDYLHDGLEKLEPLRERVKALEDRPLAQPTDLSPLVERIAEVEARPLATLTAEIVREMIQADLGKSAGDLYAQLDHALTTKIAALPLPEKGEPGEPGTSVTVEDFRDVFEAAYARFELETERRVMDTVQRTLDRIPVPKDGANGKDGLGFDDLEVVQVGERSVEMRFTRGEQVKVFTFDFPWLIDRGVWKAGTTYERGDGVTWAGSFWIAQRADSGKPGEGDGWRLAVKRGRDGKPGDRGLKGDPGPPGKNGRDLNHRLGGSFT